jgi:transposase
LLAAYLGTVTGQRTSIETVRVHLHKAGYVCKRPTWTLQRKAEEQPEWAKNG